MQINTKLYLLMLIICACMPLGLHARIGGTIYDESGEPLPGAFITLTQLPDTLPVDIQISDSTGYYELTESINGPKYNIFVKCYGYTGQNKECVDGATVDFELRPDSITTLAELTVSTDKPEIQRELGKYVFTPNGMAKLVNNSFDLLQFAPLVEKYEDSYTIIGAGTATVFINGKEPIMGQDMVRQYLRSQPSWRIKKIEVIPQSVNLAKSTVINVIMDRPEEGLLGFAEGNFIHCNRRSEERADLSVWTNYNRFLFSANIFARHSEARDNEYSRTEYFADNIIREQKSVSGVHHNNYRLSLSGQYTLTRRSNIGMSIGAKGIDHHYFNTSTMSTDKNGEIENSIDVTRAEAPNACPDLSANVSYHLELDEDGSQINIAANYGYSNSSNNRTYRTGTAEEIDRFKYIRSGQGAVAHFGKTFENIGWLNVEYNFYNGSMNDTEYSKNSNHFDYRESRNTLRVQYANYFANCIELIGALYYQNYHYSATQSVGNEHAAHTYNYLAPYVSLAFWLPRASQNLSIFYSQNINTPGYMELNPFVRKSDGLFYTKGNPDLKPFRSHRFGLNYNWNNQFYASFDISVTPDGSIGYNTVNPDGSVLMTYGNNSRSEYYGLKLNYRKFLFNRWNINVVALGEYRYGKYPSDGTYTISKGFDGRLGVSNTITLWPEQNLNMGLSVSVNSPEYYVAGHTGWSTSSTIDLSKSWGNAWNTYIILINPVSLKTKKRVNTPQYSFYREFDSQFTLRATVSYTFGRRSVKRFNNSTSTTLDSRMNGSL